MIKHGTPLRPPEKKTAKIRTEMESKSTAKVTEVLRQNNQQMCGHLTTTKQHWRRINSK